MPPDLTTKAACFLAATAGLFEFRTFGAGPEGCEELALPGPDRFLSCCPRVTFPGRPSDLVERVPSHGSGPFVGATDSCPEIRSLLADILFIGRPPLFLLGLDALFSRCWLPILTTRKGLSPIFTDFFASAAAAPA